MGFTTGFIGGLTATYTLLYLSLHLHRTNRTHQSLLLTQQKSVLASLYDPQPTIADSPAYEIRKAGLSEELKDRWNRELETAVRNLQETDWQDVRVRLERRAAEAWNRVRSTEVVQEAERGLKESVVGAAEGVKGLKESVVGAAEGVKGGAKEAVAEKRLLELN